MQNSSFFFSYFRGKEIPLKSQTIKEMTDEIRENVRNILTDYLQKHGRRKTPERYAILDTIYSSDGHFDIDSLYKSMAEGKRFRVSRATLYNSIMLFINAGLVLKHQFGNTAQYERAYNNETHHHTICTSCGKVTEFEDPYLQRAITNAKVRNFTASHYSLYIYGMCSACKRKLTKKKTKQQIKER